MPASKERLLTGPEEREPDQVPINFGGNQTGIHPIACPKWIDP